MKLNELYSQSYYKNKYGMLLNMDCVEAMKLMDDNSIDLTVTSPPYDNLRTYNGYCFDFENTAKELYRITKDGGVVVWIVNDATIKGSETGTSFKQALYFKDIGFNIHDTMIYETSKPPMNDRRYQQCFEYMFVFSKGKPKTFNAILVPCKNAGKEMSARYYNRDGTKKDRHGKNPVKESKVKDNIWYMVQRPGNGHPAVFPEQLANDHIISWSNENDIVFDPFMGSGTTAKMAQLNNRKWIGCEISQEYCDIVKNRLESINEC